MLVFIHLVQPVLFHSFVMSRIDALFIKLIMFVLCSCGFVITLLPLPFLSLRSPFDLFIYSVIGISSLAFLFARLSLHRDHSLWQALFAGVYTIGVTCGSIVPHFPCIQCFNVFCSDSGFTLFLWTNVFAHSSCLTVIESCILYRQFTSWFCFMTYDQFLSLLRSCPWPLFCTLPFLVQNPFLHITLSCNFIIIFFT